MSVENNLAPSRPGSVTTVVVLTWIAALIDVVGGLTLVVFAGDAATAGVVDVDESTLRIAGIVSIGVGILVAGVAIWLGSGSNGARVAVTFLMLLRIGLGTLALLRLGSLHATETLLTMALALVVIGLLWTARANAFFARPR